MKPLSLLCLLLLAGCEIKDRQGHTIIQQKPPTVNVKVQPNIHIDRRRTPRRPKCPDNQCPYEANGCQCDETCDCEDCDCGGDR